MDKNKKYNSGNQGSLPFWQLETPQAAVSPYYIDLKPTLNLGVWKGYRLLAGHDPQRHPTNFFGTTSNFYKFLKKQIRGTKATPQQVKLWYINKKNAMKQQLWNPFTQNTIHGRFFPPKKLWDRLVPNEDRFPVHRLLVRTNLLLRNMHSGMESFHLSHGIF